jgi:hypothetical protein
MQTPNSYSSVNNLLVKKLISWIRLSSLLTLNGKLVIFIAIYIMKIIVKFGRFYCCVEGGDTIQND